ncbi:ABC transporter permease [Pseudoalteromonas fenneropenaei]|uniref:ABC transporter permease n=1 Tax=Pseudoalteromonas fenneropenaei TaxID=1737459 RepID=A0ABV7CL45_9GAMM
MGIYDDFKYALRRLFKSKLFTLLTVAVIAIGFGLCIYMYSFLNTISFKALPFKDGERIVTISGVIYGNYIANPSISLHDFEEIRKNTNSLQEIGAYSEGYVNVSQGEAVRRFNASWVEPEVFAFTRTQPLKGRSFTFQEVKQGAAPVVVISYAMWVNLFAQSEAIIGQTVQVDGQVASIIGVMPEGYSFPRNSQIWLPLTQSAAMVKRGEGQRLAGYARVNADSTVAQANAEVTQIMKRQELSYPETNSYMGAFVDSFQISAIGQGTMDFILAIAGVVALTMLLSFINIGNLLFARASQAARETAVRVAIGAPKRRLISLMVFESGILCFAGALVGLGLAAIGLMLTGPATANFTGDVPYYWWQFGIDETTFVAVIILVMIGVFFAGVLPGMRAMKTDFNAILRDGGRSGDSKNATRVSAVLVVSEIFLTTSILVIAALLGLSTLQATVTNYGAKTEGALTAKITLDQRSQNQRDAQWRYWSDLAYSLENNPTFGKTALMSSLPGVWAFQNDYIVEGEEYDGRNFPRANTVIVFPSSLANLDVKLVAGRYFGGQDQKDTQPVAIVTQSFADKHWPQQSALGKRFHIRTREGGANWLTVVGVVQNVIHGQPYTANAKGPTLYLPLSQNSSADMMLAVEYQGTEQAAKQQLHQVVSRLNSAVPAYLVKPYERLIDQNTAAISFISNIFVLFGLVALVLAASGIFGVMAKTVVQKTKEIGIRRALGATKLNVRKLFLVRGGKQLIIGLILGLICAVPLVGPIKSILDTSSFILAMVFVGVPLAVSAVVLGAIIIPTRSVLAKQPCDSLRAD